MTREQVIGILGERLADIRRRFAVRKLSLFGSVARNEASPGSDVDMMVVFEGKATFDSFMDLKFHLEDLLGAPVDLVTDKAMRPQVWQAIGGELVDVA